MPNINRSKLRLQLRQKTLFEKRLFLGKLMKLISQFWKWQPFLANLGRNVNSEPNPNQSNKLHPNRMLRALLMKKKYQKKNAERRSNGRSNFREEKVIEKMYILFDAHRCHIR